MHYFFVIFNLPSLLLLMFLLLSAAFCISMTLFGGSLGNIAFGYLSDYLTKKVDGFTDLGNINFYVSFV